jgi:hypothetical protein
MEIYLFVSKSQPKVRAFTCDETGANLPTDFAPWEMSVRRSAVPVRDCSDPIALALWRKGYFLVSGKVHPLSGTERPFRRGGQRQTAYNPR